MADPAPSEPAFLKYVRDYAIELRKNDKAPATLDAWTAQRAKIKAGLENAWGAFPKESPDFAPKKFGELQRDGYRVEKIAFQTFPNVWMTANAYIPDGAKKAATVLGVHGHWKHAKQEPVVQSRCIGLAKLGFFVLCVDAFGAGERAIGKSLGEYHGEMTAATLWPSGLALSGLQVYENMRAVDYLATRPEADITRLGITGASGGGNQTMYTGAYDERFKAVVPVCSVGNYMSYLGAACCMCEVVPGAITFTEEWGILAMVAPRALMVINASRDAKQFSIAEAAKSIAGAKPIFELHSKAKNIRHTTFESGHDYNKEMREAMYGWMALHLRGEGTGEPIPDPPHETEKPEDLRCFPGESRPDDYQTLPRFAKAAVQAALSTKPTPDHAEFLQSEMAQMRESLGYVLGSDPPECQLKLEVSDAADETSRVLTYHSEPAIRLSAQHRVGTTKRWAILVDLDGREKALKQPVAASLIQAGWNVVAPDLRACGLLAVPGDVIGKAADHNSAEWAMWIGRPLLGQWAYDIRRTLDALLASIDGVPEEVAIVAIGPATLPAIVATGFEEGIRTLVCIDPPATFAVDRPYEKQRLGIFVPGMAKMVGDVQHLLSLVAPRKVLVASAVHPDAKPLNLAELDITFKYARNAFKIAARGGSLTVAEAHSPDSIVAWLG
jgi:dienelactone hydrolase